LSAHPTQVLPEQMGVAPPQSASSAHPTHALFEHTGVAPSQSALPSHSTQPEDTKQTGVAPSHIASVDQRPSSQTW